MCAGEGGAAVGEVAVLEGLALSLDLADVYAGCCLHVLHHAVPEGEGLGELAADVLVEVDEWRLAC